MDIESLTILQLALIGVLALKSEYCPDRTPVEDLRVEDACNIAKHALLDHMDGEDLRVVKDFREVLRAIRVAAYHTARDRR